MRIWFRENKVIVIVAGVAVGLFVVGFVVTLCVLLAGRNNEVATYIHRNFKAYAARQTSDIPMNPDLAQMLENIDIVSVYQNKEKDAIRLILSRVISYPQVRNFTLDILQPPHKAVKASYGGL